MLERLEFELIGGVKQSQCEPRQFQILDLVAVNEAQNFQQSFGLKLWKVDATDCRIAKEQLEERGRTCDEHSFVRFQFLVIPCGQADVGKRSRLEERLEADGKIILGGRWIQRGCKQSQL